MPNRIIKESVCTSDSIDQLGWFEEVLFYRLIVNCDDFGRFDGRTAVIKNRLFPLKENLTLKSVESAINKLARVGLVTPYEAGGKSYLFLPTWNEHQTVRAKKSKFPEPEIICNQVKSDENKFPRNPIQSESNHIRNPNPPDGDDSFDMFWNAYPKKVDKQGTKKAFKKVDVPITTILAALENHKRSAQWNKDGGQYIPNPTTWINQRRWESELAAKKQETSIWGSGELGESELENIRRILQEDDP